MSNLPKDEQRAQLEREFRSPYRFVIIVVIGIVHAALMGVMNQPAVLSTQIIGGMGASIPLFAQICTVGFLTGAVFSIPMGILADKWSVRGTLSLGLVVTLVGAIWRCFCADPVMLYVASFVMGFGLAGLNANSPKLLKAWFGFRRITTAMGAYVGASGIGVALCLGIVNAFPVDTMFNTFVFDACFVAVAVVAWLIFGRMPKAVVVEQEDFTFAAAKECLKNKQLMITSLAMVLFMSVQITYASQAASGFIFLGVDPGTAASWMSIASIVGIFSNFIWPWLSDKVGKIKVVLVPIAIIYLIFVTIAWYVGASIWVLICICAGFFFGFGICGFIKACVGKIPSIRRENMGTAGGIQTFFQNLGAYIIPSFVLAPIAGGNYIVMFTLASVLLLLGILVIAFLMPEFGAKGKIAQENADRLDS